MKRFIVGLVFSIYCLPVLGQDTEDCLQTITKANEEFNAGRFYGIPALLKNCIDNGFTNEQKVQAYHLLTQTYLILDDPIAAEDSYLRLLKADPEYIATPEKDPIDIVYLSKKFTATPIFTPHLRIGGNTSLVRTIYEINTEPYPVNRSNVLKGGFQLGAGLDWNISDHISIAGELLFATKSYKVTKSGISTNDSQLFTERQTWFDIPLYVKYRDDFGKIRPFGYVGVALNLLATSSGTIETSNKSISLTEAESSVTTEGPAEKLGYKRNFLNRSFVIGGGTYYKIGRDFVFVDLRYMGGLSNLTDTKTNYYGDKSDAMANTISRYRWVGDYFRLDNISLSIGYVKPLYNPRKIKHAKTKGVLKDINKKEN